MALNFRTWLAVSGVAAFSCMSQAQAHAALVGADPAPNTTIAAPKSIHLHFSEAIAVRFSNFRLTDANGKVLALMSMKPSDDNSLDAMPTAGLSPGVYTVSWTAVATDDGHKTSGSYRFTVH